MLPTLTARLLAPPTDEVEQQQQQDEKPTAEEKALLREEFVTAMHQRFLDGKDKDFDYRFNRNLNFSETRQSDTSHRTPLQLSSQRFKFRKVVAGRRSCIQCQGFTSLSVCLSEVDENPDYDNLDIVSRDAEDKYFDKEDDDEEEEQMSE